MLQLLSGDSNYYSSFTKIIIFGIGGIGVKSVQYMRRIGISHVKYAYADTDLSELNKCEASEIIILGEKRIKGLGTNGHPELACKAALECRNEIRKVICDADMVIVVADLGGGTGSGAAPVIAQVAKEQGVHAVAVVTVPSCSERSGIIRTAKDCIDNFRHIVDCLIVIPNDTSLKISSMYYTVKCISDCINAPGIICIDFQDMCAVLSNFSIAHMGTGVAIGMNRAHEATVQALSPLIRNGYLKNADGIVYSISASFDSLTG